MREIFLSREKERKEKKFGWSKTGFRPKRERERGRKKRRKKENTFSFCFATTLHVTKTRSAKKRNPIINRFNSLSYRCC